MHLMIINVFILQSITVVFVVETGEEETRELTLGFMFMSMYHEFWGAMKLQTRN